MKTLSQFILEQLIAICRKTFSKNPAQGPRSVKPHQFLPNSDWALVVIRGPRSAGLGPVGRERSDVKCNHKTQLMLRYCHYGYREGLPIRLVIGLIWNDFIRWKKRKVRCLPQRKYILGFNEYKFIRIARLRSPSSRSGAAFYHF